MSTTDTSTFDPTWSERYLLGNYSRFPLWVERGAGVRVWDQNGRSYLDFAGGIAVCPLGHCHPEVTHALCDQATRLIHVSNLFSIRQQAELARLLVEEIMQLDGKVFFCNSGAEANEGMIKLARKFGVTHPLADGSPRYEILSFSGSFHGRTFGAMSATAQEKIHAGFGPLVPGFVYCPFNDIHAMRAAITERTCAILIEPIQGEGGIHPASAEFLRAAADLCQQHQLLLLLDEVQCGFGRTGDLCGWRSIVPGNEIQPDAVSWAKSIGSGYPLGAMWVSDQLKAGQPVSTLLGPGTHGTTYGGSPLACTVGLATLKIILRDNLAEHAKKMGDAIAAKVRSWQHPLLNEIRALGLMIGFELNPQALAANPAFQQQSLPPAAFVVRQLLQAGMLSVPAGPNVIRWLPALNLTMAEAEEGLDLLLQVLNQLSPQPEPALS